MNPPVPTTRALLLFAMPVELPMSDLGYANGWRETPLLVEKCEAAGHKTQEKTIARCLREVRCSICNYKFTVDSGG